MMLITNQEIEELNEKTHKRLLELCVTRFMYDMKKQYPQCLMNSLNNPFSGREEADKLIIEQIKCLAALSNMRETDSIATASRDVKLLIDKGEAVCKEEGHADASCRFKMLHDLIKKRTGDLAKLKAGRTEVANEV